jgi:hypothetical protein
MVGTRLGCGVVLLASYVGHLLVGLVLIGGLLGLASICAMKGKWVFFALGWLSGIFWIVGALTWTLH